jgi:hypothetical protein
MKANSRKLFTILSGIFSGALTVYGLAAVIGMDLRQDTVLSVAYCALPLLSLPLYLFALSVRWLLPLQVILVLIYIPVYSALNWRTCAELGYCGSVASVLLMTMTTARVLLFCVVGVCSLAAFAVERRGGTGASGENRQR